MRFIAVSTENYNPQYMNAYYECECEVACSLLELEQMACIEDFLYHEKCHNSGTVMLEDVQVKNDNISTEKPANTKLGRLKQGAVNIYRKIVAFIKKIINAFINKAQDLIQSNEEWVNKNIAKVKGITDNFWNDCTISILPYFFRNDTLAKTLGKPISQLCSDAVLKTNEVLQGTDVDLLNKISPDVAKFDTEKKGNAADAAKAYFRQSQNQESFTGTHAKDVCLRMAEYVQNYQALTAQLKKDADHVAKIISDAEKIANQQQPVTASYIPATHPALYSPLENAFLGSEGSDCNYPVVTESGEYIMVIEAEQPANNNNNNNNQENKPNGSVEVKTDNNQAQNDQNKAVGQAAAKRHRVASAIIAAKLTIAEEAYNVSMKTLKSVVRSAENRNNISNTQMSSSTNQAEQQAQAKTVQQNGQNPVEAGSDSESGKTVAKRINK